VASDSGCYDETTNTTRPGVAHFETSSYVLNTNTATYEFVNDALGMCLSAVNTAGNTAYYTSTSNYTDVAAYNVTWVVSGSAAIELEYQKLPAKRTPAGTITPYQVSINPYGSTSAWAAQTFAVTPVGTYDFRECTITHQPTRTTTKKNTETRSLTHTHNPTPTHSHTHTRPHTATRYPTATHNPTPTPKPTPTHKPTPTTTPARTHTHYPTATPTEVPPVFCVGNLSYPYPECTYSCLPGSTTTNCIESKAETNCHVSRCMFDLEAVYGTICWCWNDASVGDVYSDCRNSYFEPWVNGSYPATLDQWVEVREAIDAV